MREEAPVSRYREAVICPVVVTGLAYQEDKARTIFVNLIFYFFYFSRKSCLKDACYFTPRELMLVILRLVDNIQHKVHHCKRHKVNMEKLKQPLKVEVRRSFVCGRFICPLLCLD